MARILIEIPDDLWLLAQKNYGNKSPKSELRTLADRILFQEGVFRQRVGWANGHTVHKPAGDDVLDVDIEKLLSKKLVELKPPITPRNPTPQTTLPTYTYWSSEERLKAQLHIAVREFKRTFVYFCTPEYAPNLDKTPEQVENFLEDIEGVEWDDPYLTQNRKNFLNLIRQIHRHWWKSVNNGI